MIAGNDQYTNASPVAASVTATPKYRAMAALEELNLRSERRAMSNEDRAQLVSVHNHRIGVEVQTELTQARTVVFAVQRAIRSLFCSLRSASRRRSS